MVYSHNQHYLSRIENTLNNALSEHPRTLAVRVDLRLPNDTADTDAAVISRFIESLKAKIKYAVIGKQREGRRIHPCTLRYVWVKEVGELNGKKHYHLLLLLNKDRWHSLGDYQSSSTLAGLIKQAWCSALRVGFPENATLAHFPDNPALWVDINSADYFNQRTAVIERASYLAKHYTKQYGNGERSFGCSNN
ncbi:inovirus Gp2 family protein [Serratia sp. D1N4]